MHSRKKHGDYKRAICLMKDGQGLSYIVTVVQGDAEGGRVCYEIDPVCTLNL